MKRIKSAIRFPNAAARVRLLLWQTFKISGARFGLSFRNLERRPGFFKHTCAGPQMSRKWEQNQRMP